MKRRKASSTGTVRRGIVSLFSGTAAGQAIAVLSTPLIARLYEPSAYGTFSVILSLAAIATPIATLKLESALLLPKSEDAVKRLVRTGALVALVVATLTVIIVSYLTSSNLDLGLTYAPMGPLLVGVIVLVTGLFTLLSQVALRRKQYSAVAKRSVTQQAGTAIGQSALSLATSSYLGLSLGRVAGLLFGFVPLIRQNADVLTRPRGDAWWPLMRRYWRFPVVFAPSALLNVAGSHLPLLLVSGTFGATVAGNLGMAQRLVFVPATLVGAAVGQVFAAEISSRLRDDRTGASRVYLKLSMWLTVGAIILSAGLIVGAPVVFELMLGQDWEDAGHFAQAMAVSVAAGFVASPLSKVFTLYQRAGASIAIDFSRIAILCCAAGAAAYRDAGAVETVALIFAGQALNYVLTWIVGYMIVRRHDRRTIRDKVSLSVDI